MTNATLAGEFVTDTIGLVLHIEQRQLSEKVKSIFDSVELGSTILYVPVIVVAEILYLYQRFDNPSICICKNCVVKIALFLEKEHETNESHYRCDRS